jgi:hypothetical protein
MTGDALFSDDGLRVEVADDEATAGERMRQRQALRIAHGCHPLSIYGVCIPLHPDAPRDALPAATTGSTPAAAAAASADWSGGMNGTTRSASPGTTATNGRPPSGRQRRPRAMSARGGQHASTTSEAAS